MKYQFQHRALLKPGGRRFTTKEEAQMRRELAEGSTPEQVCEKWKIKMARLRAINAGPLSRMGWAIEGKQRK